MEFDTMRQSLVDQCKAILNEPTRFNVRRLVVFAQCIKDLDQCSFAETEEKRWNEKSTDR